MAAWHLLGDATAWFGGSRRTSSHRRLPGPTRYSVDIAEDRARMQQREQATRRRLSVTRLIAGSFAIVTVLVLAGCDSGHYAWDLQENDLVGSWQNPGDIGTELALSADGTFRVTSWPRNLNCAGAMAGDAEEMLAAPTIDSSGAWTFYEGEGSSRESGLLATVTLQFADSCTERAPMAYFRTAEDGTVSMCFPLDRDPHSFRPSRALPMLKAPITDDAIQEACK